MKKLFLSLLVFSCLCETNVAAQTLSNLTVLQKKRFEGNPGRLSGPLPVALSFSTPALAPPPAGAPDPLPAQELAEWQAVEKYIEDEPAAYARLLEAYSTLRMAVTPSRSGPTIESKVLAYSLLAVQPLSVLSDYIIQNRINNNAAITDAIEGSIARIRAAIERITSPTIAVFATGNIRGIATSKSPEPTTTGTGSLGATYARSNHVFSVQFNVASTIDTASTGFGSLVLTPLNGKSLQSALIEWYPKLVWSDQSWLHIYGNFAGSLWEVQKDTLFRNVSVLGGGLLYHHRIFEGVLGETEIGLGCELGLSGRWIDGDIRNLLNDEKTKAKYVVAFPTLKNYFLGLEGGLTLNFGQVVGALQAYYLFPKKKEPVDGLTGLQLSVGLSVRGDVVRGFLN